jgi:hypothetical protein
MPRCLGRTTVPGTIKRARQRARHNGGIVPRATPLRGSAARHHPSAVGRRHQSWPPPTLRQPVQLDSASRSDPPLRTVLGEAMAIGAPFVASLTVFRESCA